MKFTRDELIDKLMVPGNKLLGMMSLRTKLFCMLSFFLIGMLILGATTIVRIKFDAQTARQELAGIELSRQIVASLDFLSAARLNLSLKQAGKTPEVVSQKNAPVLKNTVQKINVFVLAHQEFQLESKWRSLANELQQFEQAEGTANYADRTQQANKLAKQLLEFSNLNNEQSGLLFDPEANSYLLMDLAVQRMLLWQENLSQLSSILVLQAANGAGEFESKAKILLNYELLDRAIHSVQELNNALKRSGESVPTEQASVIQSSQSLIATAKLLLSGANVDVDNLRKLSKLAQEKSGVLQAKLSGRLDTILKDRLNTAVSSYWLVLIVFIFSALLTVYFVYGFYVNFIAAIKSLESSAEVVASGNLTHTINVEGNDELSSTGRALEKMNVSISALVANVRTNANMVLLNGKELTEGINDMSARTVQQALSLAETTGSVNALAETVKNSAKNAKNVDNLAANVRMIAEASGDTMRAAVDTMQGIHVSAMKVQEIVGMIDKIAFQTDILALNAAVEASHAGEQGKGFAVVASEVRSLAQRSADAARQIRRLIDDSVNRVELGVEQIDEVNVTLSEIVGGIRHLADNINAISQASDAQSTGLYRISEAINALDDITKSNGKMAEDAKTTSQDMEVRAAKLHEIVSAFRLRQGTADEAFDLVRRATALYRVKGEEALERITIDPERKFVDRDMYVFAFNRSGQYVAFAGNAEKLKVNLNAVAGLDGAKLIADAFAVPEKGGWIDYTIDNPLLKRPESKTSYIERISEDIVMGCGVYKSA